MLKITIPGHEYFDEEIEEFVTLGDLDLELEHSLVSLSKWESEWEKPFLGPDEKTSEETLSYVRHMILAEDFDLNNLARLTEQNLIDIRDYINAKKTATWFRDEKKGGPGEVVTSELVYYWMVSLNIPFETEHWHLNRLFTLIKICGQKNQPQKKMSRRELAAQNRALNEQRKAKLKTSG